MTDLSSKPIYKLYSEKAIAFSSFIGGPLAGAILMAINFKNLGFKNRSKRWIYFGFVSTVTYVWLAMKIPEQISEKIPEQIIQFGAAGLMYYLVVTYQKEYLESHIMNGGEKASIWGTIGYGLLSAIFMLAIIFGLSMLQPKMQGNLTTIGEIKHEIFYTDSVSEKEAKQIGDALQKIRFLTNESKYFFKIDKENGHLKILFPVKEKFWNNQEAISTFKAMQSVLTKEYLEKEVKIILFEDGFKGRKYKPIDSI